MNAPNTPSVTPHTVEEKKILTRDEASIDPVQDVIELLRDAGHSRPDAWTQGLNPAAFDPEYDPRLRRTLVNRKLHEVLGLASEPTTDARFCLVDEGPLKIWLVLVRQSVVPVMVRLDLPNDRF